MSAAHYAKGEMPPTLQWHKILGSNQEDDYVFGLAIDDTGNSVVVGRTQGALFRSEPFYYDGFYASYDPDGNLRWGFQLGSTLRLLKFNDVVALPSGGWAVIGTANYSIGAQYGINTTHYGDSDVVIVGLKPTGFIDWMTQVGTPSADSGQAIDTSVSSVVYAGDTYGSLAGDNAGGNDVFSGRYTPPLFSIEGRHFNQHQFGTDDWDTVWDMDLGYVAGDTFGSFDGGVNNSTDAFLSRVDINGQPIWTRQYGDSEPQGANAVVKDGKGGVYIAGYTYVHGSYNTFDGHDGFLAKYDEDGNFLWERFLTSDSASTPRGTANTDQYEALAVDGFGNVYAAGNIDQEIFTPSTSPAIVAKYSPDGELLWTQEIEFSEIHRVSGLAVDESGTRIWVAGTAYGPGSLGDPNFADGFLAYLESPYPAGDYNYDGQVSGTDFLMWQKGEAGGEPTRDFLNFWKANYGVADAASFAAQTAVPEPTSALLFLTSIAGAALSRRRNS